MRISDWSSDVCSSDLLGIEDLRHAFLGHVVERLAQLLGLGRVFQHHAAQDFGREIGQSGKAHRRLLGERIAHRSEEHTSELQSLMRISYAVFCSKKKHTIN